MSIWDDPELSTGGDYIKFDSIGDTVTGTVIAVRVHRWDDGKVSPQVLLDVAGEEKTITAGQVRLKAALAEQRPEPGDLLTVTLRDVEKRQGGKTLKHFDVSVVRGGGAARGAAPAPATVSLGAGMTAEQIAAAKLLGIEVPS